MYLKFFDKYLTRICTLNVKKMRVLKNPFFGLQLELTTFDIFGDKKIILTYGKDEKSLDHDILVVDDFMGKKETDVMKKYREKKEKK